MKEKTLKFLEENNSGPIRILMAQRLKLIRLCANKTAEDISAATGKSIKSIWAWEQGRAQPDADMLVILRDFYGLESVGAFYGEDGGLEDLLTLELKDKFEALSKDGKKKALSYINDLADSGKYNAEDEIDDTPEPTPEELAKRIRKGKNHTPESLIKRLKTVEQMKFNIGK